MTEFELIQKYFNLKTEHLPGVVLGNGDDCALFRSTKTLAFSMDTLVLGTHFTQDIAPEDLGYRVLAVNLSDCAAMGATPRAFLLGLTLPQVEEPWLAKFAAGLHALAAQFELALLGGNTTRGPLSITVQIIGELTEGQGLKRSAAQVGDDLYVSGCLGQALLRPQPRVALGKALAPFAHAAIDISDGFSQDLQHILSASGVGAHVFEAHLPHAGSLDEALSRGEDYELCFTAAEADRSRIQQLSQQLNVPLSRVGTIVEGDGMLLENAQGTRRLLKPEGFLHFK